jgi:LuxR family maltose regulon positive regulatory protein
LLCSFQSDLDAAERALGQSLALFRELEDTGGIAELLSDHGYLFAGRGDYERANAYYQESLILSRHLGNSHSIMVALFLLGVLTHARGDLRQAREYLEESLTMLRKVQDSYLHSGVLSALARIELEQGNYAQAQINLVESVTNLRNMDERWQILPALELFACLAEAEGQQLPDGYYRLLQSARLFGAVEALHETLGIGTPLFDQQFVERWIANLRVQLDETTIAVAWAEGRAMTLEQTIAFALEITSTSVGTTLFEQGNSEIEVGKREREHDTLTERELEVLRLIAAGHSNRQIANELFLTLNTAKSHIHHIYEKLGVASRTQAVSRAHELHLL